LDSENNGLESPIVGTAKCDNHPVFAVFDGLGGESHGEIAAYLAVKTFNELSEVDPRDDMKRFRVEACLKMNAVICTYVNQEKCGDMGTTTAMLGFDDKEAHVCNVGDSKVFRFAK
jgi:protein phosphatase